MSAVDQTPTFKLNLPTFDLRVWHTYVNENFSTIDSVLQHYLDIENLVGVWRNATQYHAGERAVDAQDGAIYECLLDNISASVPTTFAQDRASNPAYWGGFTVQETFKGTWQNSTPYSVQDFIVSGNIYAVCLTSHTSIAAPGVFGDDAVYWIYLINLTGNVLPSITGHGGAYIRARPDETATEYRTPAQVKADLGISNIVTSWNTRIGDVNLTPTDVTNAGALMTSGGTMTGSLTVAPTSGGASVIIDTAGASARNLVGRTSGSNRWVLQVGSPAAESGSNVGSDFTINRYSDAGAFIDAPLTINRASGQLTLTMAAGLPGLSMPRLDAPAGNNRGWAITSSGVMRWLAYASQAAESGGNAGSDYSLARYNDAGNLIDQTLTITRSSGTANFSGALVGNGGSLTINSTIGATFILNKAAATNQCVIIGQNAGLARWQMFFGTAIAETGSNAGSDFSFVAFNDAGASLGNVYSVARSTQIVNFAKAIVNGPSDRSLKENITPLEDSLDKVLALQGVSFNMIGDDSKRRQIGLIAQDVAPVVPEVIQDYVTTVPGEKEGETKEVHKLALDYPKLVALLVEAVKELSERVSSLEAQR
jgi:Chaperone of endosialidase